MRNCWNNDKLVNMEKIDGDIFCNKGRAETTVSHFETNMNCKYNREAYFFYRSKMILNDRSSLNKDLYKQTSQYSRTYNTEQSIRTFQAVNLKAAPRYSVWYTFLFSFLDFYLRIFLFLPFSLCSFYWMVILAPGWKDLFIPFRGAILWYSLFFCFRLFLSAIVFMRRWCSLVDVVHFTAKKTGANFASQQDSEKKRSSISFFFIPYLKEKAMIGMIWMDKSLVQKTNLCST